jgi:hypothetical protein
MLSDVMARDHLQAAPWILWVQHVVPFSTSVCVAGSLGTWLAEYSVHRIRPLWEPSDIDVFVMQQTQEKFKSLCTAYVGTFAMRLAQTTGSAPCRVAVQQKYCHIFNVQWWVTWNGNEIKCPDISLIYSPKFKRSRIVVDQFDIDICKIEVRARAGSLCLWLNSDVLAHIRSRRMHCVVRHAQSNVALLYPIQRIVSRIHKYTDRGYVWHSLQFLTHTSALHVSAGAMIMLYETSLILQRIMKTLTRHQVMPQIADGERQTPGTTTNNSNAGDGAGIMTEVIDITIAGHLAWQTLT